MDKINPDTESDCLRDIGGESVYWEEDIARDAGADECCVITSVRFLEFVTEIVEAVECDNDFEITETFLYLRADISKRTQALQILPLYPRGEQLRYEENSGGWQKRYDPQSEAQ